mgnify:CR=1 FL=1
MLKITVDTNTLISATITKGNEFELLRLARLGRIKLILSPQILKEFKEVISRPKFGFSQEQINNALKQIINVSSIVMPSIKVNIIKDDPEDNKILECAVSGKVDYIVSGDSHLLKLGEYESIKIVRTTDILKLV